MVPELVIPTVSPLLARIPTTPTAPFPVLIHRFVLLARLIFPPEKLMAALISPNSVVPVAPLATSIVQLAT